MNTNQVILMQSMLTRLASPRYLYLGTTASKTVHVATLFFEYSLPARGVYSFFRKLILRSLASSLAIQVVNILSRAHAMLLSIGPGTSFRWFRRYLLPFRSPFPSY